MSKHAKREKMLVLFEDGGCANDFHIHTCRNDMYWPVFGIFLAIYFWPYIFWPYISGHIVKFRFFTFFAHFLGQGCPGTLFHF